MQEFKSASATVFDTRPWVFPVAKTKIKFPDHVDAWAKAVKQGIKKGIPILLDITEECPQFQDKLITHAKYKKAFPEQVIWRYPLALLWSCLPGIDAGFLHPMFCAWRHRV